MELSNMILENLKGAALEQITQKIGGDNKTTKSIAAKALPMLLGQLEKNTATEDGANSLNDALNSHLGESKIDLADGAKILGHLFWNKDEAIETVAKASGQDAEKAGGVMSALSSVIMETLWDQKKASGWFDTGDIMKLLAGTGKDANILGMVMDQDGDGDFDKQDAMKFGMGWLKNKFLGKK